VTGRPVGSSPSVPPSSSGRRISPGVVFLVVALIASIAYVGYAITVRDASQIPLLASGAVVLAIAFGALTVYCFGAVLRAGREGRDGWAILIALLGGGAAIATASALAAAVILFQLSAAG
jgi:hypothetical protein